MRDAMPGCAALVDDLRAAFGAAEVDQWIRDGLRDGTFHAVEGNHQIGKPQPRVRLEPIVAQPRALYVAVCTALGRPYYGPFVVGARRI